MHGAIPINLSANSATEHTERKKGTTMNNTEQVICGCCYCGQDIIESEMDNKLIGDHHIYKCGELKSIELFHLDCVEQSLSP
jgi:hypothetical protein